MSRTHDASALLDIMIEAALAAGEVIDAVYAQGAEVRTKPDGSPVTQADERAEAAILSRLALTGLPVLAEESASAGHIPVLGTRYFIVDPLDGTKEFIKRNGEFTVNIALVEAGRPILGVVTAPAFGRGWLGQPSGAASFALSSATTRTPISIEAAVPPRLVASRSHGHHALARFGETFRVEKTARVGSSLKFCLLAEGKADIYPRFTPTAEWDTAAGQAVLEAAGGCVLTISGNALSYGKHDTRFLNPVFVAAASEGLARQAIVEMAWLNG